MSMPPRHEAHGIRPPGIRPTYENYRSPYGPQYTIRPNFHGITSQKAARFGFTAALFGGVAGIAVLYMGSDVPRIRIDIMQKIPLIGPYFVKEVPPEDDPF